MRQAGRQAHSDCASDAFVTVRVICISLCVSVCKVCVCCVCASAAYVQMGVEAAESSVFFYNGLRIADEATLEQIGECCGVLRVY